jgi:hypothetical protein
MDTINKAIKQIVSLPAWAYIEDVFKEEILEGKKPLNFKTEGKTAEMIALEVMAREMSAKIVDRALKKLKRIGSIAEYQKESYK